METNKPERRSSDSLVDVVDKVGVLLASIRWWLILILMVACAGLGGIAIILWVLALSSYQRFGFVLDAKTFSVIATVSAIGLTIAFLYAVVRSVGRARREL